AGLDLRQLHRCLWSHERDGAGRPDAIPLIDLAVVNGAYTLIAEVCFRHAVATDELGDVTERLDLDPLRGQFGDQLGDTAHALSRSATIASICSRSFA